MIKLVIKSFKSYENETVYTSNKENNSIYTINNVLIVSFPTSLENIEDNLKVVSAKPELSELRDLTKLILLVLNKILLNQNNILKEIETDIHNYQFMSTNNPNKRSRYESKYLKYKNKYLKLKNSIRLD